jgi:sugar lactone lactonase YvrE
VAVLAGMAIAAEVIERKRKGLFDASGQERSRIQFPIPRPTCVTFGGPDLTNLYITSASVGLSQNEIQKCHTAGDIFCLSSVAQGMPTHSFGRN